MAKTIRVTVEGKTTLPYDSLEPFQGELKRIERPEYEQLRKNIIENGFSFVVHVWKDKKHHFIIDGHQRVFTVKQMVELEKWICPQLPVAFVQAETFKEAKRKVLAAASQYGKVNPDGLVSYLKENEIPYEDLISSFHFPEIDFTDIAGSFNLGTGEDTEPDVPDTDEDPKTSASGSVQVRQLQLFFNAENYVEFVQKVEELRPYYKMENITDTLMEMVREAHKTKIKTKR